MKRFLEKYNCFHDGILRSISFSTKDNFSGKSHDLSVTGEFKAVLDISHYNYENNLDQKSVQFKIELEKVGPVSFCSCGEIETPNNWALRKVGVTPVKDKPGKWLLELHGDKYSVKAGKWVAIRLAVIEFASYTLRIT